MFIRSQSLTGVCGGALALLLAAAPADAALMPPMVSQDFAYGYEANVDPIVASPEWGETINSGVYGDWHSVSGGVLSIDTITDAPTGLINAWEVNNSTAGGVFSGVGSGTSITVETRARVTAGNFQILLLMNDVRQYLNITPDSVGLGVNPAALNASETDLDNATDFHTYRVAFDSDENTWHVWRDNDHLFTAGSVNWFGTQRLVFGDNSANVEVIADVDYLRWDLTGAYDVPEPASLSMLGLGALMLLSRRRRESN